MYLYICFTNVKHMFNMCSLKHCLTHVDIFPMYGEGNERQLWRLESRTYDLETQSRTYDLLFRTHDLVCRTYDLLSRTNDLSRTYDLVSRTYDLVSRKYNIKHYIFFQLAAIRFRRYVMLSLFIIHLVALDKVSTSIIPIPSILRFSLTPAPFQIKVCKISETFSETSLSGLCKINAF